MKRNPMAPERAFHRPHDQTLSKPVLCVHVSVNVSMHWESFVVFRFVFQERPRSKKPAVCLVFNTSLSGSVVG